MKLIYSPLSPYARKVRIVLAEKRMECDLEAADVSANDNPVNAHNPLGKIPVLLLDDGSAIFDSRVIVEFLDNISPISRLIPDDNRERVAVRRWEALADGVLDAGILVRQESLRPKKEQSKTWITRQVGKMSRGIDQMAKDLNERAWCNNDKYSLADIAVICCLGWLDFRKPGNIDWRAGHANLLRHFNKISKRPAVAQTVPK